MLEDVQAGSSTATNEAPILSAVDQAIEANDDAAYLAARRAERSGKTLEPRSTPAAEATTAEPAEQAASTDANEPPASEPGKAKGKGIKARTEQVNAEIAALQERLKLRRALREELGETQPADANSHAGPSPGPESSNRATAKRDIDRFKAMPGWPTSEEYPDYDDLSAARADFIAEQRAMDVERSVRSSESTSRAAAAQRSLIERGTEAFEDFSDVLAAAEAADVVLPPHVAAAVLSHPQGHVITYELLSQVAEDASLLRRLGNPVEAGIVIGQILAGHRNASPERSGPEPQFSKAPSPPTTLGRKTSDESDPILAAVNANDEAAFLAARRAQRAAARR